MGLFDFLHRGKVEATEPVEHKDYYQDQPNSVPTPTGDFSLEVEDVFTITGRGTVVTGRVTSGTIKVGETVYINRMKATEIGGIEQFRKMLDYAQAGDNVGLLLRGVDRNDVSRGDILTK